MRRYLLSLSIASLLAGCDAGSPTFELGHDRRGKADDGAGEASSEEAVRAEICAALADPLRRGQGLGMSLGLLRDGALVWSGGCGNIGGDPDDPVASVSAEGWPAKDLTVWPVSSVSKLVLGVVTLQVVEELAAARAQASGRPRRVELNAILDEDAGPLIRLAGESTPALRHPERPEKPITLRMLLTHSSGVTDDYALTPHAVEVRRPGYDDRAPLGLREALRRHLDPSHRAGFLGHGPGAGYSYSSTASSIAALLVRPQTGRSFAEHALERVFAPLGMDDTRFRLAELRDPARAAAGLYRLDEERVLGLPVVVEEGRYRRPYECSGLLGAYRCTFWEHTFYPAASLRTTVVDFAAFVGALMSRGAYAGARLLESETLLELSDGEQLARYGLDPAKEGYQGLIVYWQKLAGEWYACHSGRNPGYTSLVCFLPAEHRRRDGSVQVPPGPRHGVIVFSNADGESDLVGEAVSYLLEQARPGGLLATR
jgi:CubicO group peptidase (beta-lactamase class C family)